MTEQNQETLPGAEDAPVCAAQASPKGSDFRISGKGEGAELASRQIARATGIVMIAFIISSLVGIAHQVVITDAFGTSAALDSFNAANRITELLFNLTAGGALGSAFIPLFTGFLTRDDKKGAWRLASGVVNVVFLVLIAVSILAWIFAPWIVKNGLYALTADSNMGQLSVTVRLLRIMLPTVVIFGISGLVMGMLNAHRSFLIPALAPAMYSLGIIFGTLALPKSWGVDRLAIGVVLGRLRASAAAAAFALAAARTKLPDLGWDARQRCPAGLEADAAAPGWGGGGAAQFRSEYHHRPQSG